MPIYNYHCESCNADVELIVRSTDKPVCPECGSKNLTKQITAPNCHKPSHGCKHGECDHSHHGGCGCGHGGGCCCHG
ncbi:MAG: zinc ribbon domain-containing protein [Thermoguttaceae bacterium]|nr:zinc ribbon domain-containing protein [Thermoguttaceae bacterium]